jgi:hypothetical protein
VGAYIDTSSRMDKVPTVLPHNTFGTLKVKIFQVSICDIRVKQKISVINETKQEKISLEPKVLDREKLHSIL